MAYINHDVSTMAMPSGMNRMGQFPLDMSSVFYSESELRTYATSGAIAYVGQIVSLVDETNKKVTVYSIQNTDGLLKEVGTVPVGASNGAISVTAEGAISVLVDGTTIKIVDNKLVASLPEVDDKSIASIDGKISMHDFGVAYYEYVPEVKDENGEVTKEASYAKVAVSESKPWKAGLEPKVVTEEGKLVIGWFEPNPTTIEGVNDQVTAVQGTVADLELSVGTPSAEGQEATGLYKEVEDVQADVEELADSVGTSEDALGDNVNTLWANVNDHSDRIEALETKEDKDTKYTAKADDKVLKLTGTEFSTELSLVYNNQRISLTGIDGEEIAGFDASAFVEDGVLNNVSYDAENNKLIFIWNIIESTDEDGTIHYKTIEVPVGDLVDTYTAGQGISIENNVISVKRNPDSEDFLSFDPGLGMSIVGVQDAIDTAKQEAIDAAAEAAKKYDSKAEAADVYTKTEANNLLSAKANSADVYTKTEADNLLNAKANSADVYTKTAADGLLDAKADKTTVEATYATKEALKATDDVAKDAQSRVGIVEGKIDEITSVGGEPNVVEKIKVNGVTLEVEKDAEGKSTKTVNIAMPTKVSDLEDDKTYDSRITAAQAKADEGVAAAGTAQAAADKAQNAADVADSKAVKNAEDITALKQADATANGKIQALENTVNNTTSGVAANYAAVVKNAGDIATLNAKDKTHDEDIAGLKTSTGNNATAITNLQTAVANVYTKTEADGKFVAKEEGKSLIATSEIERLAGLKNYDDSAVKALIQGNTDAITNITKDNGVIDTKVAAEAAIARAAEEANANAIAAIYKVDGETKSGVLVSEITRVEGLISAEKSRAEGVEADHEGRIAEMEKFWEAADDPEGTIDKLAEIVAYIADDKTGALDMAADIKENADAIAAINDDKTGILANAKTYTNDEIAKLTNADTGILAQAKAYSDGNLAAAKSYSDGNLATAKAYSDANLAITKKYTDDSIAALKVKDVDNNTLQLDENGVASVKAISTDLLAQGKVELIFSAGNASGYNTQA